MEYPAPANDIKLAQLRAKAVHMIFKHSPLYNTPIAHIHMNIRKRLVSDHADGLDPYVVVPKEMSPRRISSYIDTHDGKYALILTKLDD